MLRLSTIAIASLLLTACGTTEPDEIGSMEALISGNLWQAERTFCFYNTSDQDLEVWGSRPSGTERKRFIQLLGLPPTAGTVTLAADGPRGLMKVTDAVGWESYAGWITTDTLTGTATITEFDVGRKRCSGTFSFVAVAVDVGYAFTADTVHVTNGLWTGELHEH